MPGAPSGVLAPSSDATLAHALVCFVRSTGVSRPSGPMSLTADEVKDLPQHVASSFQVPEQLTLLRYRRLSVLTLEP